MAQTKHLGLGVLETRWFDERHHTVRPLFEFLSYALKDRSDAFTYERFVGSDSFREAVRFIVDWATAGHPFTPRPNPLAFDTVYRHYREWGWDDAERSPLGPSTCLAIIRNVRSGKLVLQYCRMCQRLHVRAVHPEEIGHGGPQVCIFCHSPHTISCSLTPDHRLLKPA